jgi:hypothetical protein
MIHLKCPHILGRPYCTHVYIFISDGVCLWVKFNTLKWQWLVKTGSLLAIAAFSSLWLLVKYPMGELYDHQVRLGFEIVTVTQAITTE